VYIATAKGDRTIYTRRHRTWREIPFFLPNGEVFVADHETHARSRGEDRHTDYELENLLFIFK
jgi:hypothetical protein